MMRKRRIFWVSLGLLALLAAAGPPAYYLRAKLAGEHFYRGRSTSYWAQSVKRWNQDPVGWSASWVDRGLDCWSYGDVDRRIPAVLSGAPATFPVLVDLTQSQEPGIREEAIELLGVMSQDCSEEVHSRTRKLFLEAMTDETASVRYRAVGALENAGFSDDEVVAALCAALKDPEERCAMAALPTLRRTGAKPEVIVTAIVQAVRQQGPDFLDSAVVEMGRIPDAVPKLTEALAVSHPQVRRFAARALGKMGSAAKGAIPALRKASHDQDDRVRQAATESLELIRVLVRDRGTPP
jgi:HEAT repeat protein